MFDAVAKHQIVLVSEYPILRIMKGLAQKQVFAFVPEAAGGCILPTLTLRPLSGQFLGENVENENPAVGQRAIHIRQQPVAVPVRMGSQIAIDHRYHIILPGREIRNIISRNIVDSFPVPDGGIFDGGRIEVDARHPIAPVCK